MKAHEQSTWHYQLEVGRRAALLTVQPNRAATMRQPLTR